MSKDACSKQLILLPPDDLYAEFEDEHDCQGGEETVKKHNLFVSDCLKTYLKKKYEIQHRYSRFGGNYRQLPGFNEHLLNSIDREMVLNNKTALILPELFYEIDAEENTNLVFIYICKFLLANAFVQFK